VRISYRVWTHIALTLVLLSAQVQGEVLLTGSNRMLPVSALYQPFSGHPTLDDGQFASASKDRQPLAGLTLRVTSTLNHSSTWYLSQLNKIDGKGVFFGDSDGKTLQPLAHTELAWPVSARLYALTLAPNASIDLYIPAGESPPQQLWSANWWDKRLNDISAFAYLAWGGIASLLLAQLCLILLIPIFPRGFVLIQLMMIATLAICTTGTHSPANDSWLLPLTACLTSLSLLLALQGLKTHIGHDEDDMGMKLMTLHARLTLGVTALMILLQYPLLQESYLMLIMSGILLHSAWLFNQLLKRYHLAKVLAIACYLGAGIMLVEQSRLTSLAQLQSLYVLAIAFLLLGLVLSLGLMRQQLGWSVESCLSYFQDKDLEKKYASLKHQLEELSTRHRLLQEQNNVDFLTGLKNRQFFDQHYQAELARSARDGSPLSLILIDLDFFKRVNDTYGHQTGDEVLKAVAKRLHCVIKRPTDSVSRYGGEEFVVLLPNTALEGARHMAESIRLSIKAKPIHTQAGSIELTVSQGVASQVHRAGACDGQLLTSADLALYKAKEAGRDRVELAFTPLHLVNADAIGGTA
jgi:diguanylate cyclase